MQAQTSRTPPAIGLFRSFFQGGFECSAHRMQRRRRLDLLAGTGHDRLAGADYAALRALGTVTVRDGLRWHLIEREPGRYDWSSMQAQLNAAGEHDMEVIWDLCHYGWPDFIDIWQPGFVQRHASYCAAAAGHIAATLGHGQYYCPINEISFWAWAGGDVALFNPWGRGRGMELKKQLVRASLASIDAIRRVDPSARFALVDPVIHVVSGSSARQHAAKHARSAQFEAWEMIRGTLAPELGGRPESLDIVGVNYYPRNQWVYKGRTIAPGSRRYLPFRELLVEIWERYRRPLFVAETGSEGASRVEWLRYICDEVHEAMTLGVPMQGICLYPITDYPGWANNRHCECGLLGLPDSDGRRDIFLPLAEELQHQRKRFEATLWPAAAHGAPALS